MDQVGSSRHGRGNMGSGPSPSAPDMDNQWFHINDNANSICEQTTNVDGGQHGEMA